MSPRARSIRFAPLRLLGLFGLLAAGLLSCSGQGPDGEALDQVSEPVVVCAKGPTVDGIDVSSWQGTIDWSKVKASGRVFAIARISDGSYIDVDFPANWSGMKSVGMVRGAYQYFRPGQDPVAQANSVIKAVGMLGDGDLPVTLDVEASDGQSAATIVSKIHTWADKVAAGTGKRPMIYTAKYFWNGSVATKDFAAFDLWVANYYVTCPDIPTAWTDWKFFQYTDKNVVPGISGGVDGDKFNGTLADLKTFAGATPVPTVPTWAAEIVTQSHPATMKTGEIATATLELKNVGSATWNTSTGIGTTVARDRTSPFEATDWSKPNRPDTVTGTVAPGATYKFSFKLQAPTTPGKYTEHFGVVQDGKAWFSDPGQGGPKDDAITWTIDVQAGSAAGDGGNLDTGTIDFDAGGGDAGAGKDSAVDLVAADASSGGCGCRVASGASGENNGSTVGLGALALALALAGRRRPRAR
jgi:lysozyme